jgi:hypothetical protein
VMHTPKPWYYNSYSGIWAGHTEKTAKHVAKICDFKEHGGDALFDEEAIANAHLIAAAPLLLETLEIILDAFQGRTMDDMTEPVLRNVEQLTLRVIRQAKREA